MLRIFRIVIIIIFRLIVADARFNSLIIMIQTFDRVVNSVAVFIIYIVLLMLLPDSFSVAAQLSPAHIAEWRV